MHWLGHHDRGLRNCPAGVELLTTYLGKPRANNTQNDIRVLQFLSHLGIEENCRRPAGLSRRHVDTMTIHDAQRLEPQRLHLIAAASVRNEDVHYPFDCKR